MANNTLVKVLVGVGAIWAVREVSKRLKEPDTSGVYRFGDSDPDEDIRTFKD